MVNTIHGLKVFLKYLVFRAVTSKKMIHLIDLDLMHTLLSPQMYHFVAINILCSRPNYSCDLSTATIE